MNPSARLFNNCLIVLFIAGIGFMAFVGGMGASRYEWPQVRWITRALESADAWRQVMFEEELPPGEAGIEQALLDPEVTWDKTRAYNGYTLVTLRYSTSVYLLDMAGKIVHQWDMPFHKAWPNPSHVPHIRNTTKLHIVQALLFPNGDLLAIHINSNDTPYGYGMVKMDKDSNVLWTYDERVHHDAHIDQENGNIYTLIHRMTEPKLEWGRLPNPVLEDYIVTLSPEGKELDRVSITDAFHNSPFALMLYHGSKNVYFWDHFHTNSVMKLEPSLAAKFPMFKAGQILISMRNMNTVAVVDLKVRKVVWAHNGLWQAQHAAEFLDNGHILLLDNKGHVVNQRAFSRLIEFDPATLQVAWHYLGNSKHPFYTDAFGRVQRFPNGNTLATDSLNRRIFEVTAEGDIVWDYRLPSIYLRDEPPPVPPNYVPCREVCLEEKINMLSNRNGVITTAERYTENSLPFLNRAVVNLPDKDTQDASHP